MFRSCGRCGKIHDIKHKCRVGLDYNKYKKGSDHLRNTHEWHTKAEEIKRSSQFLCAVCRERGIYNYKDLEVHHIIKLRDDPDKLLDNYNLICLCRSCHKAADRGEFSNDLLFNLARVREDLSEN